MSDEQRRQTTLCSFAETQGQTFTGVANYVTAKGTLRAPGIFAHLPGAAHSSVSRAGRTMSSLAHEAVTETGGQSVWISNNQQTALRWNAWNALSEADRKPYGTLEAFCRETGACPAAVRNYVTNSGNLRNPGLLIGHLGIKRDKDGLTPAQAAAWAWHRMCAEQGSHMSFQQFVDTRGLDRPAVANHVTAKGVLKNPAIFEHLSGTAPSDTVAASVSAAGPDA